MIEIEANFWDVAPDFAGLVCPINWTTNKQGELIMRTGMTKQFATRYPMLPELWGKKIQGKRLTEVLVDTDLRHVMFGLPTKLHWHDPSPLWLVIQSCRELVACTNKYLSNTKEKVLMLRPGCVHGGLCWNVVKPRINFLDERFVVTHEKD